MYDIYHSSVLQLRDNQNIDNFIIHTSLIEIYNNFHGSHKTHGDLLWI